jgi:hypothetical protein
MFESGTRLGAYDIVGLLGAGGMGEVYRARDTRLKREVALKILPDSFAADPERLARFQREAEVLASLNHPNIAGIHGIEDGPLDGGGHARALVLELVEGETLAERIARGPVALDDVLAIAGQITEALEAAHEHGVVHRDLKPANIKLRPDGTVKVLDFGLAKLVGGPADGGPHDGGRSSRPPIDMSMSPTITSPAMATSAGMLLGTAAYMSPEQAKGRAADHRSDIFAFGCVLYELATGKRAFIGEDISNTIAAVLRGEPDWSALPSGTPRAFERIVRRCLQRERKSRYHDIGDVRLDLLESSARSREEAAGPAPPQRAGLTSRVLVVAATAVSAAALAATAVWWVKPAVKPAELRFTIPLAKDETYSNTGRHVLAISPNGKYLVYGAGNRLNLHTFDQLASTPIRGSEAGGRGPFFSPDGEWIGFWQNEQLMKVAVTGGGPIVIAKMENPLGASWSEDGSILLGMGGSGIWRLAAAADVPEKVIAVKEGELAASPQMLPGGEWVLFTVRLAGSGWDDSQIVAQSLRSSEQRVLVRGGRDGRYVPTGHVLYARAGTMMAVPFDLAQMKTVGNPVSMLEGINDARATTAATHFALSATGTLAYVGGFDESSTGTPVWFDRSGREVRAVTPMPLRGVQHPRLSPDGRRLSTIEDGDVWVHDLEGRPPIRLTHDPGHFAPLWTPDGKRLIYESNSPAPLRLIAADGSDAAPVPVSPVAHYHPHAVTADGRTLIAVEVDSGTRTENHVVSFEMGEKAKPTLIVHASGSSGFEGTALSPDDRWLAFTSSTTGQPEIWVQPYPGPGAPVRVSPNGGVEPIWARNGRELYYLEGRKMMAVAVDARTTFDFKPATLLFETTAAMTNQPPSYDVAADGRFLMIKPALPGAEVAPMVIITNWFEELTRRVPVQ